MNLRSISTLCGAALLLLTSAWADEHATPKRFGNVTEARVLAESNSGENWLVNGGDFGGAHFSPLDQIDAANAKRLGLAWVTDIPSWTLVAEPLVVDGVIFLTGVLNQVFALDATTGEMIWQFDPEVRLDLSVASSYGARMDRGVAVWEGRIYTGTGDCRLIALDATDGTKLWESRVCDPKEGKGSAVRSAPRVGDGKVFVGHSGSSQGVRGSLTAFDAVTGEELWRFWTVPADPKKGGFETPALERASATWTGGYSKKGGGAVWEAIRYDPVTESVIFGTASTTPKNVNLRGPGDNLYTNCIMAVDAATGAYKWHYQTVPSDTWDYDATMPLIIRDLDFGGKKRRVVMQAPKNGFFYVLDARTGELLAADPLIDVTWATHVDMETGRPVEVPGARYYANEDPEQPVRVTPSASGAHNWNSMSFNPETGLVYLAVTNLSATFSILRISALGFGPDEELPPDVGRLVAWDPLKREARWTVNHPYPFNGGVLSTAGNLVFHGTATGEFFAYSADRGELLWSLETGSTIHSAPVSYAIGGEQYVLAGAGVGGGLHIVTPPRAAAPQARGPARLFAFKLGGKAKMPALPSDVVPVPKPPARTASAEQVERGDALYVDAYCLVCHGAQAIGVGPRRNRYGEIPDLRYMPPAAHEEWQGIVLGGNRKVLGMPSFHDKLSVEDSQAIHAYVIDQAWKLYEKSNNER